MSIITEKLYVVALSHGTMPRSINFMNVGANRKVWWVAEPWNAFHASIGVAKYLLNDHLCNKKDASGPTERCGIVPCSTYFKENGTWNLMLGPLGILDLTPELTIVPPGTTLTKDDIR